MSASLVIRTHLVRHMVNGTTVSFPVIATIPNAPHRVTRRAMLAHSKGLEVVRALGDKTGDVKGVYVYDQAGRLLAAWSIMEGGLTGMTGRMADPLGQRVQYKA